LILSAPEVGGFVSTIGDRVKEERLRNGWSQKDLARESRTNVDTISGIETGQHEPRPSTLRKLARALNTDVRDLFEEPTLAGKAEAGAEPASDEEQHHLNEETLFRQAYAPNDLDVVTRRAQDVALEARKEYQDAILGGGMRLGIYDDGETIEVRLEPMPPSARPLTSRLGRRKLGERTKRENYS
jgi:transcriptional regulator with XRE-family HTH domain